MPGVYGGEIFGKDDYSSLFQTYIELEKLKMRKEEFGAQLEQRKAQQRKEQQVKDYKVGNAINATFDDNHLTTGTPADPVINARLTAMMDKYSKLYKDSRGSLDVTDMNMSINRDMMDIKAYYDSVNVIKSNAMKSADALAKQYPGFNKQELYQKAMDRALYKDGQVIQDLTDLDLQNDYVNDVVDNDYGSLHIGLQKTYDDWKKLPMTKKDRSIVTRDKTGAESRYTGNASFNEKYQDLMADPETGEPKIGLRTMPATTHSGASYIDKLTGQPVNTIDDQAFQDVMANRQAGAYVKRVADEKLAEIKAKNIPTDETDLSVLQKQAATQYLKDALGGGSAVFKSYKKEPVPRGRYRVGTATDPLPFNLDAMQQDAHGNRDLTPQIGGFTVKDPTSRSGSASAELWLTPDGGLIPRTYEVNSYGRRIKQNPDPKPLYGQSARNFINNNSGWPANSKKDMFKLLEQFNGKGEAPSFSNSDLPYSYDHLKNPKPVVSKPFSEKKSTKPSKKNSLNW